MRRSTTIFSLALAALALGAGPVHGAGLPQLDPSKFAPQVIWLAITFLVLYVLNSRFALPRIGRVLEERQQKIDDSLEKATSLKAEAEAAQETYEKALAEARADAQEVIREAGLRLAEEAAQRQTDLAGRLAGEIAAAEERIAAAKAEAVADIRQAVAEVTHSAVERLLGEGPSEAEVKAAVAAALKEGG